MAAVLARFAHIQPRTVLRCTSPAEVAEALALARRSEDGFAVRSGGHCFAGRSSTTGVLIDTRPLSAIALDGSLAAVGAGARLAEVYDALAAHGRTIAGGCGPEVGIAGLALGGGLGILGRRYGLLSDQLVAAQVVLADGRIVECDEEREPDLFWALRGAGGGRFGIVTRLVFRTLAAGTATVLHLQLPLERAAETIAAWQAWSPFAPDELAASLLVAGGAVHVFGAYLGPRAEAAALLEGFDGTPRLEELPLRDVKRRLAETGPGDGEESAHHRSGFFARPIPPEALVEDLGRGELDFSPWAGAYNRVPPAATAFPHRDALFCLKLAGDRAWVERTAARVLGYGTGGVYPNFPEPERDPWDPAYHLGNRERLLAVKAAYDPDGIFM